jgi:translation initiation factor RLI1
VYSALLTPLQAIIKPQYVDHIPKAVKGLVLDILTAKDERKVKEKLIEDLGELLIFHVCLCVF